MTSQLMIKSHTGVMVTARVGMHYRHDVIDRVFVLSTILEDSWIGQFIDDTDDTIRHDPKYCTMIFCPPAVGDEVEHAGHKCIISEIDEQEGDCNLIIPEWNDPDDTLCVFLDEIRHADPNLRPIKARVATGHHTSI